MDELELKKNLIDEISSRPILYNSFHADRKNRKKLSAAWKEVSFAVELTVAECMSKWANLRTTYTRKHKKVLPSGSATQQTDPWPFLAQMSFMEGHVKHRKSTDNFTFTNKNPLPRIIDDGSDEDEEPAILGNDIDNDMVVLDESSQAYDAGTSTASETSSSKIDDSNQPSKPKRRKIYEPTRGEIRNELMNFLKRKDDEIHGLNTSQDRFDAFGSFVAAELRLKEQTQLSVVQFIQQQICRCLLQEYSMCQPTANGC